MYQNRDLECDTMRYVELDELLAQSDIISLHVPSLPGQPLINAKTIARMKDGVILINTSRGTNVDEEALLAALESGKVYGAGLDVFAEEPPKNAALLAASILALQDEALAARLEAFRHEQTQRVLATELE